MNPQVIIKAFDTFLAGRGQSFSAIIIGGGALSLMGVISRETQDIDVLDPILPPAIVASSHEFAAQHNANGTATLKQAWLNNGPESLRRDLPGGWQSRTQLIYSGAAIELHVLGRSDLLKSKLFAFCDREMDRQDCLKLKPTEIELKEAMAWVKLQDQNPGWPAHVEHSFHSLAKELGYGV